MEPLKLKGKRKKPKPKCPNPLFIQWLREWKQEAEENGWKTQYTFSKALSSLKKFPLPLTCGKDCSILQNFGDKLCKMLDDRLAKHLETHGTTAPVMSTPTITESVIPCSKTSSVLDKIISSRKTASAAHNISEVISDESDDEAKKVPKTKRQKCSGNRQYIPAYRSGAYAILLALYRNTQNSDSLCDFMTRTEIIQAAEPFADKSFTACDPDCYYTSWSSMGTLVKRGLVTKNSSPARYSLTQSGIELAQRLQTTGSITNNISAQSADSSDKSKSDESVKNNNSENTCTLSSENSFGQSERIHYWFVTSDDKLVVNKEEAAVSLDDNHGICFLVKCNYQELLKSGKTYKLDISRPLGDDVYAYLCDADADDVAFPPIVKEPLKEQQLTKEVSDQPIKTKPKKQRNTNTNRNTAAVSSLVESSLKEKLTEPNLKTAHLISSVKIGDDESMTLKSNSQGLVLNENAQDLATQRSAASCILSTASTSGLPPSDFTFLPDSFDIILCVDNREFYGSGNNSKTLLPDLIRNGVQCDLRPLHVGDMLWIAREKSQNVPGQIIKPQGRELVLDYVIERKTMDDLVSSTIDGRFREQKFRLKRCGVRNAIYLIEECKSMQHFSISEDKLKQAITNTQVIDGFQIKKTGDVKETVTYLTIFTRYLQSYYRGKRLHACSLEVLQNMKRSCQLQDDEQFFVEFQHFNQGSIKSKNLTLCEMFGKQLIQLHGMSADKAKAIIDQYPTVTHLFDAYAACQTEKERESLLANIKVGKLGRNMGIGQSRQIYQLYWTNAPLI